ncbi:MAG: Transcriptional regulator, TetR family [Frankiales bacterium]|nr:Transcriptional regulator, TetR family [Frankiales bacterium]
MDTRRGTGRVYGGLSQQERRAERRGRLLAAGLQLFGTEGWLGTTIERLCAEAQVSTRYFYEEFRNRENLMEKLFASEVSRAATMTVAALRASQPSRCGDPLDELQRRLALTARSYVHYVTDDPRRLRVIHKESRAVAAIERTRDEAVDEVTASLWTQWFESLADHSPQRAQVRLGAVRGALNEVLLDWWMEPEPRPDVAPMAEELATLFVVAISARAS